MSAACALIAENVMLPKMRPISANCLRDRIAALLMNHRDGATLHGVGSICTQASAGLYRTRTSWFGEMFAGLLLASCLSFLLLVSEAHSAAPAGIRIGAWSGGPVHVGTTKQFEYCTASTTNAQGIVISYSIDRQYRWRLAFANPTWSFSQGYALNMLLRLGEKNFLRARATVNANRMLDVQTDDDLALFPALWSASMLQVTAGGLRFEFELAGSNGVFAALVDCIRQRSVRATAKNVPTFVTVDAAAREEARSLAAEILSFARIRDAQILPQVAGSWRAGLVTSTLDLVRVKGAEKMRDFVAHLIRDELGKCREGVFLVWALEEVDRTELGRMFVICPRSEGTTFSYLMAATRPQGGHYILRSSALGGGFGGVLQQSVEEMDAKLRPAFALAVKKEQQQPQSPQQPSPQATPDQTAPGSGADKDSAAPTFTSPFGRY